LQNYDISVPLGIHQYRGLILTQSCTLDINKSVTLSRAQRFEALTGSINAAIFFLPSTLPANAARDNSSVQDQLQSFQNLQLLLLNNEILIPVLYTSSPAALCSALKCLTGMEHGSAEPNIPIAATSVLPYCTLEPPMSQEALTIISDMFPNLQSLTILQREEGTRTRIGKSMCEAEVEACLDFWKEEYLAE
jgi:hypothetical protein